MGMEGSRIKKKGTVYVQTTLKRKKTAKSSPKTGASAVFDNMKEEYVVDEIELSMSSILSKHERTAMRKLVNGMAQNLIHLRSGLRNFGEAVRARRQRESDWEGGFRSG